MLYVKRPAAMNFWMENLLFIAFRISVSQLIRAFDSSQYSHCFAFSHFSSSA